MARDIISVITNLIQAHCKNRRCVPKMKWHFQLCEKTSHYLFSLLMLPQKVQLNRDRIHRQHNNSGCVTPYFPFSFKKSIEQRRCGRLLLTNQKFQFWNEARGAKTRTRQRATPSKPLNWKALIIQRNTFCRKKSLDNFALDCTFNLK